MRKFRFSFFGSNGELVLVQVLDYFNSFEQAYTHGELLLGNSVDGVYIDSFEVSTSSNW